MNCSHKQALVLLCFAALCAFGSFTSAAEIVLKNGSTYEATILRTKGTFLLVEAKFGQLNLPLSQIASIDGKPYQPPNIAVVRTPAAPRPTAQPSAAPTFFATPVPEAPTPETRATAAPLTPAPAPKATVVPVEFHRNVAVDWKIAAAFGILILFLIQLVWVQYQMNRRARVASLWNVVVFFLPGIGLILFLLAHFIVTRPKKPFGGHEDVAAADKKRPVFNQEQPKGQGIGLRFVDEKNRVVPPSTLSKKGNGLELGREILEAAVVQRASDIHIEPQSDLCRVRFRIDGQLAEHRVLPSDEGIRLITSLKSLAGIDVAEKRKAQDGRFHVKTDLREVDFRVATANAIHGEKIVIRILDRKGGLMSLDQVGMSAELESTFDRTIHARAGMIIVTGPTGSGKTSTLYAALSRLDREKLNVMTIEDPVEYELEGATQIPVAPKAGTTYESGLRSILRQDPDVILVGEMRDAEAATVAIRAALTGHLVFTSLHTRDSIATLIRLEEMGMERSQMAAALIMLVAQRLVRVLCPDCRKPVVSTGQEMIDVGIEWEAGATVYEADGCPECDGTGYRGRTGIFEVLVLNDTLRQAVQQGASQEDILALARANGFRPYREDGATKALLGVTSIAEVLEAT